MKRTLFAMLFLSLAIGLTDCQTNNTSTSKWEAIIGGSKKTGRYYTCFYEASGDMGLIISLHESSSASIPYIQLTLEGNYPNDLTAGNYPLSSGVDEGSYINTTQTFTTDNGGTGSLTLSKFNLSTKKISGTFSFTGKDSNGGSGSLTVTNGSFTDLDITVF
ncbi:MAG: hypothetical protein KA242_04200 [Chitinophagales bacterium]|nr:hypothetical protein [Chitinophagales bacterium]